ncbi:hypothetical protein [Streptosporangium canum]|uniref:hypothetical protein n=1 Tax=Streptosporangium canum TaxID=324952 RepID=UPI00379A9A03
MTGTPHPEDEGRPDWFTPQENRSPAEPRPPAETWPAGETWPPAETWPPVGSSPSPAPGAPHESAPRSTAGAWPASPGAPGPHAAAPEIRPPVPGPHPAPPPTPPPAPGPHPAPPPAPGAYTTPPPVPRGRPPMPENRPPAPARPAPARTPGRRREAPRRRSGGTPPPQAPVDANWTPGPRRTFSDEQVWPPVPKPAGEPPGASTQPFPAVPGPPLPRPVTPGILGAGSGAAAEAAPGDRAPATPGEAAAAAPVPPPRRRTALRVGGAVLAVAVAMGIPTWHGYVFYRSGNPAYQVHTVAAGDTGTLMNVAWKVGVEQTDSLPGARPIKADQRWLKIKVTRTSLNTEGVIRRGDPEIKVKHPDGRAWQTEVVDKSLPVEVKDHKVGVGYDYNVISLVPEQVAGEVEVEVLPSTIRVPLEEESVEDLFKRAGTEKTEPQDQVLLFRR